MHMLCAIGGEEELEGIRWHPMCSFQEIPNHRSNGSVRRLSGQEDIQPFPLQTLREEACKGRRTDPVGTLEDEEEGGAHGSILRYHSRPMQIRAAQNASEDFAAAYDEYADEIFRYCYFHCSDREIGREIMQDTFLKTWEYISKGNDVDHVRGFLYRTAKNLIINAYKKKSTVSLEAKQEETGFDPGVDDENLARDVIGEERAIAVLRDLEEPYREAIVLHYIEGLQPAEIAEVLGETANAVSVRLHRAVKKLRSLLPHG